MYVLTAMLSAYNTSAVCELCGAKADTVRKISVDLSYIKFECKNAASNICWNEK